MMRLVPAILAAATILAAADLGESPVAQLTARMAQMDRKRMKSLDSYSGTLHYILNNNRRSKRTRKGPPTGRLGSLPRTTTFG